jgi:hypothetical protein
MDQWWWVWHFRVLFSAIALMGSIYLLSVNVVTHLEILLGTIPGREFPGYLFGELKCSLAAAFHVWLLCALFKKARAVRARERQRRLTPEEMDMV